jgi:hypothetical protein
MKNAKEKLNKSSKHRMYIQEKIDNNISIWYVLFVDLIL